MSATWNAARLAAAESPIPAEVIDTETAAGARPSSSSPPPRPRPPVPIAAPSRRLTLDVVGRVRLVAVIDGLDQLVRSGRVPGLAGWAGRVLGLKPLFEFRHGVARRLRPAVSREAALSRILGHWRRSRAG